MKFQVENNEAIMFVQLFLDSSAAELFGKSIAIVVSCCCCFRLLMSEQQNQQTESQVRNLQLQVKELMTSLGSQRPRVMMTHGQGQVVDGRQCSTHWVATEAPKNITVVDSSTEFCSFSEALHFLFLTWTPEWSSWPLFGEFFVGHEALLVVNMPLILCIICESSNYCHLLHFDV